MSYIGDACFSFCVPVITMAAAQSQLSYLEPVYAVLDVDLFLLFHFPVRRRADLLKKTGVKKPLGYGKYSPSGMSNPWLTGYYPFASMYLVLLPSPILISAPLCTNRFSILAADAELVPVICSTSRRVIISFVERYARTVSSAV